MTRMGLELATLSKQFGAVAAVDRVSLAVRRGEFFTLLGPSGCGKTTLLRLIAGILDPDGGAVRLNDADITRRPMHARNVGLVFQNYALFPHLTVFQNVAFGLQMRRIERAETASRVGAALEMVRLGGLEKRRPAELSGGQQQRVALARAMVIRPDLLLLDEPLSNLDTRLREEMRGEIGELQRRIGITTVLVTHDIHEAFAVSERVAIMRDGRIEQVGTPVELYDRPINRFVARFVGPLNEWSGQLGARHGSAARFTSDDGLTVQVAAGADMPAGPAWLLVRPERVRVAAGPVARANAYPAVVERVIFLGNVADVRVRLASSGATVTAQLHGAATALAPGRAVQVGWDPADCVVGALDQDTGS
jgi:putative spermidine/putrescine transport system ATP-binding protein